jgi:AcrR family transcriptional regulator
MSENESRRGAKRQQRGLHRQAAILDAAGLVFSELGYGHATTNAIAARAGVSPGSLYQFFPNKEAIAYALAQRYKDELHTEWDTAFSPEIVTLPLNQIVDLLIDSLLNFNRARPSFSVLFFGEGISPQLASMGHELHDGMIARFTLLIEARNPTVPPDHRELVANVMMKIYKAFVPGLADSNPEYALQMIGEMKAVMRGYLAPYIGL